MHAKPVLLGAVCIALVVVPGCGYPEVSPTTYEYAKALVSITNRRASEKLEPTRAQIADSLAKGDVTDQEAKWLKAIIDDASAGNWTGASQASRRIMEDQIKKAS